jgi:hypothetical protein
LRMTIHHSGAPGKQANSLRCWSDLNTDAQPEIHNSQVTILKFMARCP